ncbi:GAF and ANTAR domain-containing protein [uncultured Aeromicrobium sp.]|uniref:GAF and ANTAR domain-containing protein n=1 Tax=uncultured Aeromicrobium sp. TaxID=337820 RepID=UPI0025F86C18|nr:GAF and ANTAR domain-containing protein [uncultured Aeromicrobium sp.]
MTIHGRDRDWSAITRRLDGLVHSVVTARQDDTVVFVEALELLDEMVPEADAAAISTTSPNAPARVAAATKQLAELAARLEHERGEGPTIDALEQSTMLYVPDIAADRRWPDVTGPLAEAGIGSALCVGLQTPSEQGAVLSLYATVRDAFDEQARDRVAAVAAGLSLVAHAVAYRDLADQLVEAVRSNREIGIATGVVMTRHGTSADEAFAALRRASERQHRKLREVARGVIVAGDLTETDAPSPKDWRRTVESDDGGLLY